MDLSKADRTLRNLKSKSTAYTVALGDGISCRVAPNDTKTLELRARLHDKLQRFKLGHYPATTITTAVAKAAEIRAQLKEGMNPKVEQQRAAAGDIPRNVKEAADRFVAEHINVMARDRWRVEATRIIDIEILPALGSYPLQQLRRTDLTALVDKKAAALRKAEKRGIMANRLAAVLGKLFTWCADKGWLSSDLGRRLPKPAKEQPRDRALTPEEAGALWNLLAECATAEGPILRVHARVLQLLAITGARCSEITGLTTATVDLKAGTFTISNGKNASSNRTLPLTPAARAVIEAALAEPREEGQDLVFPSPRVGGRIASNEISRSARDLVTLLKHTRWTPHDLRRTAASVMADAGIDGDVRRRVTGHQAPDVHGRVYDRALRLEAMREGLLVVERWVLAAASAEAAKTAEQGGKVVRINRKKEARV